MESNKPTLGGALTASVRPRSAHQLLLELRESGVSVKDLAVLLRVSHAYASRKLHEHVPLSDKDIRTIRSFHDGMIRLTRMRAHVYNTVDELRSACLIEAALAEST